jgi:hypothetical protein
MESFHFALLLTKTGPSATALVGEIGLLTGFAWWLSHFVTSFVVSRSQIHSQRPLALSENILS